MRHFLIGGLALLLVSCGQYQNVGSGCGCTALSVELIKNDERGLLRNALATHLSESRKFAYTSSSFSKGKLIVDITKDSCEDIGLGVHVDPVKRVKKGTFAPMEANRTVFAKVSVVDRESGTPLIEPFTVSASIDFDFTDASSLDGIRFIRERGDETTVLQYSMGQLDTKEGALAESSNAIYDELSRNIINGLKRAKLKTAL